MKNAQSILGPDVTEHLMADHRTDAYGGAERRARLTLEVVDAVEALNYCTLTRAELRSFASANGSSQLLLAPDDGETIASEHDAPRHSSQLNLQRT